MQAADFISGGATRGGFLLVLSIVVPLIGVLLLLAVDERHAERMSLVPIAAGAGIAIAILVGVLRAQHALSYALGGWAPPLGIVLRADGFSAAMILTAAVVIGAVALFARGVFAPGRQRTVFWILLLALWSSLNLVFLGGDLFNLYVALEMLTFSAVPLVCLDGRAEVIAAALRYMLFALLGSLLYLLGIVLLYGAYGTLDIALLSARVRPEAAAYVPAALITAGLVAKTALFPLHLWLPPAHAGAPPAASAMLSALVVKGSFFLVLRLWFDVMPGVPGVTAGQVLAALGAAAILVGSVLALRVARLKMLVAYSTVAQLGYLFLIFPLAAIPDAPWSSGALEGGILQAASHAFAKAAMFMAAGLIAEALGHDRIAELGGIARALPMTVLAFGLGGLSLMGVPPSGGFAAKLMLLRAALASGQWWWGLVMLAGGLFAGGYVFRVLASALADPAGRAPVLRASVARGREAVVLALAIWSVALGLVPLGAFGVLQIGRPDAAVVRLP